MYEKLGVKNIMDCEGTDECVDLREWCSPIEDQNPFNSCTGHAGVGLVEFFVKKVHGTDFEASPFFLYKVTRNLIGLEDDEGAFLRDTMKAMGLFGVPPEDYCRPQDINDEPSAFCYVLAQNYQADAYYRLDPFGTSPCQLLHHIKVNLSLQLPSIFGFRTYVSIGDEVTKKNGNIPFPSENEKPTGGHAVVAVGYDDKRQISEINLDFSNRF